MSCKLIEEFVQDDDTVVYLKLFALLYADDTIILAESAYELQAALHGMFHYCSLWKLQVNSQKTKIVVFGNKKTITNKDYTFGLEKIESVSEYTYLGLLFKANGNLQTNIPILRNVASKAMYSLLKKSRRLGLDIDVQLQLFDSVVAPVALYGCEIWGFMNTDLLEKLHLRYCKMVLKVKKSTNTCMVYGELGRLPLQFNIDSRMLCFWYRIFTGKNNKFSITFYKLMYKLHSLGIYSCKWITKIENTLSMYDMANVWVNQTSLNLSYGAFKHMCKNKMKDYYNKQWLESIQKSSKCIFYKEFKKELKFEKYLNELDVSLRFFMVRYRTCNHRLPIEEGRFNNVLHVDRKCTLCDLNDIGDEYHYFCKCPKFKDIRCKFLKKCMIKRPSVQQYCDLMGTQQKSRLIKIAKFAKVVMSKI